MLGTSCQSCLPLGERRCQGPCSADPDFLIQGVVAKNVLPKPACVVRVRRFPCQRLRIIIREKSGVGVGRSCCCDICPLESRFGRVALTGVAAPKTARSRAFSPVRFFNVAFFFPVDMCRGHAKTPPGAFSNSGSPTPRPKRQDRRSGPSGGQSLPSC